MNLNNVLIIEIIPVFKIKLSNSSSLAFIFSKSCWTLFLSDPNAFPPLKKVV